MINIPSSIKNPSHRYKMPAPVSTIEGKGNGTKTNIVNLQDIAKALRVPTEYPLKFIGAEVGAINELIKDPKSGKEKCLVNGPHTNEKILTLIDKFIAKYVLCEKCKLPEITLLIKKKSITSKCHSCGFIGKHDTLHKVAAYIIKHPPEDKSDFKPKGEEESKKEQKDSKEAKDIKLTKAKEQEKLSNENVAMSLLEKARVAAATISKTGSVQEIESALYSCLTLNSFGKEFFYFITVHCLFDENITIEIETYAKLLKDRIDKDGDFGYIALVLSIEQLIFVKYPALKALIATILQTLYNNDLIVEEFIFKWKKSDAKLIASLFNQDFDDQFKKAGDVFFKWLSEADDTTNQEEIKAAAIELPNGTPLTVDVTKLEVKQEQLNIDAL